MCLPGKNLEGPLWNGVPTVLVGSNTMTVPVMVALIFVSLEQEASLDDVPSINCCSVNGFHGCAEEEAKLLARQDIIESCKHVAIAKACEIINNVFVGFLGCWPGSGDATSIRLSHKSAGGTNGAGGVGQGCGKKWEGWLCQRK